jgi:hypothetical protein
MAIIDAEKSFNEFMSSIHGVPPYLKEEEEDRFKIPDPLIKIYNQNQNPLVQQKRIPTRQVEQYNNSFIDSTEPTVASDLGAEYTLDELEQDPEFQERAERFMESINQNEDIFEYIRDANFNISSALMRSFEIADWSEEAKADYTYLKTTFDKASIGGLRQGLRLTKDMAIDVIRDPLNLLFMATAPITMGASIAARGAIQIAVKEATKKIATSQLTLQALKSAKKPMMYGALEGSSWAGAHDFFIQQGEKELDLRDSIDLSRTALSLSLGAGIGGIFSGAIGTITALSPVLTRKLGRYSNEDEIIIAGKQDPKKINKQYDEEQKPFDVDPKDKTVDTKNKDLNKFLEAISLTIGKPTTRFMRIAENATKLTELLSRYRNDWYRTFTTLSTQLEPETFGGLLGRYLGTFREAAETAFGEVKRVGFYLDKPFKVFPKMPRGWVREFNKRENDELLHLIINPKTKNVDGLPVTKASRDGARYLSKNLFGAIHKELVRKKLLAAGIKNENYFPRKPQYELIEADPIGYQNLIIKYGYADPVDTISKKHKEFFINVYGKKMEGVPAKALTVDRESFSVFFQENTKRSGAKYKGFKEWAKGQGAKTEEEILKMARGKKSELIRKNVVAQRNNPFETSGATTGGGTGFLNPRIFDRIPDEEMLPYIDTRVQHVTNEYVAAASLLLARTSKLGRNLQEHKSTWLMPIRKQLMDNGVHVDVANAVVEKLETMYKQVAGIEMPQPFGVGKTRDFIDFVKLSQQMAHLPFATLSSLTEPLIMLTRVGAADSPKVIRDVASALTKETFKTFEKIGQAGKRQFGIATKGTREFRIDPKTGKSKPYNIAGIKISTEEWREAYQVGLALEQAVMDRMAGLYGETVNTTARKLARGFFKTTLLTQWTSAVQLAAYTTGKRLIRTELSKLAKGGLSKTKKERIINRLNSLSIDEKKGVAWYKRSLDENGEFNVSKSMTGRSNIAFYNNNYMVGANRFSREIILNPDITEVNKPLWYAHPGGQLLMQFASYPTAFNNTILKRFANEAYRDFATLNFEATPKILATALLMSSSAMLTNALRSGGKSFPEEWGGERTMSKSMIEAVERWGGLGPLQYGWRFWENAQMGGGQIGSLLKAPTGPLAQDALDAILYRKGFAEILAGNVPFYGVLPRDTRKVVRDAAKGIDKAAFSFFAPQKKPKKVKALSPFRKFEPGLYAKGGIVTDVPQVKEEPDERVDRMTGIPYNIQAGILGQDEEDRFRFAEGGEVTEQDQEAYSFLTKELRKLAPIFSDPEPLSSYTKEELKTFVEGIKEPVYRSIKRNTEQQSLEDFRNSETIGIHVSTDKPSINSLEGYVRLIRPLDLSKMDISFEGFSFVEAIETNEELQNKIVDDSILPNATAKEYIEDLLFKHGLAKEVVVSNKKLMGLDKILNIRASHEIRDTLKDIGYDSILYADGKAIIFDQGQFKSTQSAPIKNKTRLKNTLEKRKAKRDGGVIVSVGITPIDEEDVSKLRKALKKRKAKREGGRIGFQEGTPTMEEIVVTGISPTSSSRRLKQRGQRYFGQGTPASWERYPTLRSDWKPIDPGKFAEWGGANMPITDEQYEEWGKQGYSYDDIQESLKDIATANEKAWDEFVKTSVLDEATGQRYSQEEWKKMQGLFSKERKLSKKVIKAKEKAATEKRDKEASGGKVNV